MIVNVSPLTTDSPIYSNNYISITKQTLYTIWCSHRIMREVLKIRQCPKPDWTANVDIVVNVSGQLPQDPVPPHSDDQSNTTLVMTLTVTISTCQTSANRLLISLMLTSNSGLSWLTLSSDCWLALLILYLKSSPTPRCCSAHSSLAVLGSVTRSLSILRVASSLPSIWSTGTGDLRKRNAC